MLSCENVFSLPDRLRILSTIYTNLQLHGIFLLRQAQIAVELRITVSHILLYHLAAVCLKVGGKIAQNAVSSSAALAQEWLAKEKERLSQTSSLRKVCPVIRPRILR